MYSSIFKDSIHITHSLPGAHFGQSQNLHGHTYVVEVEIYSSHLDEFNQIIDDSVAKQIISKALSLYNFKNLDILPELHTKITTQAMLSSFIADKIDKQLSLIDIPNKTINQIKVTITDPNSHSSSYWKRIEKN